MLFRSSRSGPPQARWLEPDVNDHLEALAAGRLTDGTAVAAPDGVVVAPIGFVADHMEVVFDLDTEARATAERLAMPYVRAATAGTHPAFIASLADGSPPVIRIFFTPPSIATLTNKNISSKLKIFSRGTQLNGVLGMQYLHLKLHRCVTEMRK